MRRTARGDLCFESAVRTKAPWPAALSTCANLGFRLPSVAEVGEVWNNLGAPQSPEWVSAYFIDLTNLTFDAEVEDLNDARQIESHAAVSNSLIAFRCVIGATN